MAVTQIIVDYLGKQQQHQAVTKIQEENIMEKLKATLIWMNAELNWRLMLAVSIGMLVQAHFGVF
tara:strand:- start:1096 stop:1290 length:195 start_codon:yes stop_codon:yes gene_type:complete